MNSSLKATYLTPLENAVIEAILQGTPELEQCLRIQFESSTLGSRELNGYGFFTNFVIPENAPACPELSGALHASAIVGGQLCGFILWITEAAIDFLEGYPLGADAWPEDETFESITFNRSIER